VVPAAAQVLVGDGTVTCGVPYTVVRGDSLSKIAERAYGDAQLFGYIANANRRALGGNPENISVGQALRIPCVDASGQVVTAEQAEQMAAEMGEAVAAGGTLSPDQLDTLFGPVALFPDPLLNQILVAVTFPLDVVKAGRFVTDAAALSAPERAAQAATQDWDPSVQGLAGAFPAVVTRMNDHIDWTEQAGEAVLAQTDDVLASIQRLRQKAQENGYLVDNQAQTVVSEGETIVIQPADPQVIYVPTYSSEVVYSQPITSPPVYYYDNDYDDWDDALVAGGIILGGAVILDEVFDDDDWDDWGGWDDWGDDVDIDWDRGDIDIDVDRNRFTNIEGGDRIEIGDRVEGGDRIQLGDRVEGGDRIQLGDRVEGGDRIQLGDRVEGGDRIQLGDRVQGGDRVGIGQIERSDIERPRAGEIAAAGGAGALAGRASVSNPATRDAARQKIEARQSTHGAGVANLGTQRPSAGARPSNRELTRPQVARRPQATVSRPSAERRPATTRAQQINRSDSAFRQSNSARAHSVRGSRSMGGRDGGGGRVRRR
jgi:hypothetical protein